MPSASMAAAEASLPVRCQVRRTRETLPPSSCSFRRKAVREHTSFKLAVLRSCTFSRGKLSKSSSSTAVCTSSGFGNGSRKTCTRPRSSLSRRRPGLLGLLLLGEEAGDAVESLRLGEGGGEAAFGVEGTTTAEASRKGSSAGKPTGSTAEKALEGRRERKRLCLTLADGEDDALPRSGLHSHGDQGDPGQSFGASGMRHACPRLKRGVVGVVGSSNPCNFA
mmetsp:Transcript_7461/g.20702  ORF Transcript_7461/g.20702 Transcript_7461/m.20702 type:complete len:222 (-) Transcript_7461:401-1066(-)